MRIEIVTTPNKALKESGFGANKVCQGVLDAIKCLGHSVKLSSCITEDDLDEIVRRTPDLVVLAVKYLPVINDDDVWLADYFSRHGVNFTGSSRDVLKFDSNKVLAKTHLANNGVKTSAYFVAIPGQYKAESELPITFPLFIKPLDAANGNGIDDLSFVTNFSEYESKVASLYQAFKQPALVEEYLDGREFTVAIIKLANKKLLVSAIEIIPPESTGGLRILGAQAKKDDSEELIKIGDNETMCRVTTLAIDAFNKLGVRDFGRIDIKSNRSDECFFMEANLVPGMTYGSSYFPEACIKENEFSYDKVIELMLDGGLGRAFSTIPPNICPGSNGRFIAAL